MININGILQSIANVIAFFVGDLKKIAASIGGLISLALGVLADPTGFLNNCMVGLIDFIAFIWPSTPDDIKIANMIAQAFNGTEDWATFVVYELANTVSTVIAIVAVVKIYKLIPFKFS